MNSYILLFITVILLGSCNHKVEYLDKKFPDTIPRRYAEGLINLPNRFQQNMTMTSDGSEHYFTVTNGEEWRYISILRARQVSNKILIDTPQFVRNFTFQNEHFIGEPMISHQGNTLFFVANYPPNIWTSKRSASGSWAEPEHMEISTTLPDWYPTLKRSGDLYFSNGKIHKSSQTSGHYVHSTSLEIPSVSYDVVDPFVSNDESFIIFSQRLNEASDQTDLFITINIDNNWSTPLKLGSQINTKNFEFAPYVSPDGKYLFFSRRDRWENATYSHIYWVSMKGIKNKIRKIKENI